ncbi:MAG TPA: hypothetical protein VFC39_01080 [Acidobacteriaceae bacterium]|nr:hypothetical protein [Acidobacteriaceae bacterium]
MRRIGFSTGALARGDFRSALVTLHRYHIDIVELSALRAEELEPLVSAMPSLDLTEFSFVSLHAPSRFEREEEGAIVERLASVAAQGYPVVVHPDVIFSPDTWKVLGSNLLIENMDKRKPVGRTVRELDEFFIALPAARFCFDVGHARQVDPSMTEAVLLLDAFRGRLAAVHMSEVNTASRHDPISRNAVAAFSGVLATIPEDIPIILEPLIDRGQSDVPTEVERAQEVFAAVTASAA